MVSPSVFLPSSDESSAFGHRPHPESLGAGEFSAALQNQQSSKAQGATASTTTSSNVPAGSFVTVDGDIIRPMQTGTATLPPPPGAQQLVNDSRLEADGRVIDNVLGTTIYDPAHGFMPPGARSAEGVYLMPNGQTQTTLPGNIGILPSGTEVLGAHDYDFGGYVLMENGNKLIKPGSWVDGTGDIISSASAFDPTSAQIANDGYVQLDDGGILRGDVLHTEVGSFILSGTNGAGGDANLEAMVQSTYVNLLGREGEPAGIANWLNRAQDLRASGVDDAGIQADLDSQFRNSNEFIVKDTYRRVLGREGEASGVEHWIGVARGLSEQGYTPDQIRDHLVERFMATDEYQSKVAEGGMVSAASLRQSSPEDPIPPLPDPGSSVTESEKLKLQLFQKIGRFVELEGSTTIKHNENGTVDITFNGSGGGGAGALLPDNNGIPFTDIDNNAVEVGGNLSAQTTVTMDVSELDEFLDAFNIAHEEQSSSAILENAASDFLDSGNGSFLSRTWNSLSSVVTFNSEIKRGLGQAFIEGLPGTAQIDDGQVASGVANDMNLPTTVEIGAGVTVSIHGGVDGQGGPNGSPIFNLGLEGDGSAGFNGSVTFNPDGTYALNYDVDWNVSFEGSASLNTGLPPFVPNASIEGQTEGGSSHGMSQIYDRSGQLIGLEFTHNFQGQYAFQHDQGTNSTQEGPLTGTMFNVESQHATGGRTEVRQQVSLPPGMTPAEAFRYMRENPDAVTWRTEVTTYETDAKSKTQQAGAVTDSGYGGTAQYTSTTTYETIVSRDYMTEGGFDPEHPWVDPDLTADTGGSNQPDGPSNQENNPGTHHGDADPSSNGIDDDDRDDDDDDPQPANQENNPGTHHGDADPSSNGIDHNSDPHGLDDAWADGDLTVDVPTNQTNNPGTHHGDADPSSNGIDDHEEDDDDSVGLPPPVDPGGGPS